MQYETIVTNIIRKYGQLVRPAVGAPYRAFIQPLRYQNKLYLAGITTPLGYDRNTHYLYLGPPDVVLADGDRLTFADMDMVSVRCEQVMIKNTAVYTWAVLKCCGADDEPQAV